MPHELIDPGSIPDRLTDPGPGEHLWIFTVAFRLGDETARAMAEGKNTDPVIFDHENLMNAPAPGCYKCEQPFSKRLYYRKCTGNMAPMGF